jgi:peptide/nickel transport system substrate-binding protein
LTAKPAIKKIRIKFICCFDFFGQLKAGEMSMVTSEAFNSPIADVAALNSAGYNVVNRPATTWEHLDFRFDYAPFKDKVVREAIFRAINRQRIVDTVYRGQAGIMNGVVPPGIYYSLDNPDFARNFPDIAAQYKLPIYDYDPARARQLLDDGGWKLGPDGLRTKGGVKLSFIYGTTTQAARQQIQALVSADLKAIGIDAITKNYSASLFFDESAESPRVNGTIKLAQFSWTTTRDSDFSTWTSRCDDMGATLGAPREYCNQKLDQANAKFNTEADLHAQVEAAAEAQFTLMQDIVVVPLVLRSNIEIVTNKLANHKITNSLTSSFWNARQWYFKQP